MAVGTQLVTLRQMLNGEIDDEQDETVSSAGISNKNQKLNNQQAFLANQHTYLLGKTRVSLPLVAGQQYYNVPAGIDIFHLDKPQYTTVSGFRYEVLFGIDQPEYNVYRSDLGVTATPVLRWDLVNVSGNLQIECWPIPSLSGGSQTLEFSGLLPLTTMVNDNDTCIIDDMALVLFTAAEMLAKRNTGDAQAKLAKAQAYLASIRSGKPGKREMFNISGGDFGRELYETTRRPTVAITVSHAP